MLSFLKKLFGFGNAPAVAAPYKVEAPSFVAFGEPPATVVFPVEGAGAVEIVPVTESVLPVVAPVAAKKPRAKKPAVIKAVAEKKPRAKKAPKA